MNKGFVWASAVTGLLLLGAVAQAAPVVEASGESFTAIFASPAPDCAKGAATEPGSPAVFTPEPTAKAQTCGSCSETVCQGAAVNSICKIQSGRIYRCANVLGNFCSISPLAHDCSCWYGPLP